MNTSTRIKTSLIVTVFNEEGSIINFLDSIKIQTLKPVEIIIVDGGSKDNTAKLIKDYKKLSIKLFRKKGNRSIGRNFAIKKAANEIIAVSDAGCILDKNWLERITRPFKDNRIDVVAGFYKPVANNVFEKSLASYTCFPEEKIDRNFLPSSRSVAFTKSAWKKAGGYPEELDTCEDLVFAKRMKDKELKFKVVKNAIVFWPQRKNLKEAALQFFNYAKGDGQAFYIRRQTPLLFLRYVFVLVLLFLIVMTKNSFLIYLSFTLFSFYILWAILKNYDDVNSIKAFIYLPVLQFVSDFAVMSGFVIGLSKKVTDIFFGD